MVSAATLERASEEGLREELVRKAREMLPGIAARREEGDRLRDTPEATIAEIRAAGLNRVYQPRAWGGFEADPRTFFAIQNVFAEVCPSTAWVYGVHAIQPFLLGGMSQRAQQDVWGEDPDTLCGSSFAPSGKAERVSGGYKLSGRWTFSSGSTFTKWAIVGAKIADQPPAAAGPPALDVFLIPSSDYRIIDVWDTFGLRATGSNDLVGEDIFVPEHRYLKLTGGLVNATSQTSDLPRLYRFPWLYLFSSTINNLSIGVGRGALAAFVEIARKRVSPITGKVAKDDPLVAIAITRLMTEIETAEAMYDRHIGKFCDYIDGDIAMPLEEGLIYRSQMTAVARRIATLLDDLTLMQGSRALFRESLLTRFWLDMTAARTHVGNDPLAPTTMLGQMQLAKE